MHFYMQDYADHLLWSVIYRKYVSKTKGAKVLEVGSAPGRHLAQLYQTYGIVPFGIVFSEVGVELNRKIFVMHNQNPNNVFHAGFFSKNSTINISSNSILSFQGVS